MMTMHPTTETLSKSDLVKIPTIISNKVLMAPGTWNGVSYSPDEIKRAFENTDWSDKDVTSIILDHADKPLKVADWTGWVKNPRLEGENLVGDLELYDEPVLIKLLKAKAKFGISPRVKGLEDNGKFKNFIFENFSIVTNPAVKKAYINLSQKENNCKEVKMTEKELNDETEEDEEIVEDEAEEPTEETPKKKKKPEKKPDEEEPSDEEMMGFTLLSDWTDFVSKMRKKNPGISFKEIAKAYKKKSKEDAQLEQISDDELLNQFEKISAILKKKQKYPYPAEEKQVTKEHSVDKKLQVTIQEMSQKIEELQKKLDEPASKTVELQAGIGVIRDTMSSTHSDGTIAMADFLTKNYLK